MLDTASRCYTCSGMSILDLVMLRLFLARRQSRRSWMRETSSWSQAATSDPSESASSSADSLVRPTTRLSRTQILVLRAQTT